MCWAAGNCREAGRACARMFAETTRDGVYTHGINRFPRFVATIRNGSVDVAAAPRRVAGFGALERWDGCGAREFECAGGDGAGD